MSAVAADLRIASPWKTALPALAALLAAVALLYRDTAVTMVGIWYRSETFAHCFLVLPITLWLVWRRRAALARLTPRPSPAVMAAMLAVAAAWLLADLVAVNAATQFAFVALLVLAVPAVLGLEVASAILFPLLFLFFAVPFGEFLVPTMMEWTADFTVFALQRSGVPVFREGQHFVIPSGQWSVIDECSGVRYVMASFMVGSLFAYLNYRSYMRRAVFMAVALVLPVVANWFRAYMIVMIAHLSGNRLAVGVDHILYGWVFFGIIIFLMFVVGARWSQPDAADEAGGGAAVDAAGARRGFWGTALAAAVVVALPPLAGTMIARAEGAAAAPGIELPARLSAGWADDGARLPAFMPQFANPSALASRIYSGPEGTVGVHIAYVRGQTEARKLATAQHQLVAMRDADWSLPQEGSRAIDIDGSSLRVRTAEILGRERGGGAIERRPQLAVWRLYWVDGRWLAGDVETKLYGGLARLQGRGDEGALVVLYADEGTPQASDAALAAFVAANLGPLNDLLQRTRGAR
ncbi:MAG: exosortase A [Proteobacteria bacterium]|nr:exosortase A [Pseudomonadota bacterium]